MAKDSYWFRHDSTAGRGIRMRKMAFIYGHWGKGIYWDVIEYLRDQSEYKFEYNDTSLQMLADIIGCKDAVKFVIWFNDCVKLDLLQTDSGLFFSNVLIENMITWESAKNAGIQSGKKRKERKANETPNGTVTESQHKSTVYTDNKNSTNNTIQFLKDLENSTYTEATARDNSLDINHVKTLIPIFQKSMDVSYKDFAAFALHFKRWVPIHLAKNPAKKLPKLLP